MPQTPPSAWFDKLSGSLSDQYPDYSKERRDRIAAGIWHKLPDERKQSLSRQLEGKDFSRFADEDEYWDGVIESATNPTGSHSGPNLPDDDAVMMSYGTRGQLQAASFRNFCKKNGLDADAAIAAIDAITDAFEDNQTKIEKEEMKRQEQEAPIHDAMQLQTVKSPYITDDDNPALQEARAEDEWGREFKEGKQGDERHTSKPVIASYQDEPVQFNPPLTTVDNLKRTLQYFSEPMNEAQFTPQARKAIWRGISNAAKYIRMPNGSSFHDALLEMKRVEYDLEPTFDPTTGYKMKDVLYAIETPLLKGYVKSAIRCKDPENCEDPSHDHQFVVEGFVTTPIKDLQGEVVSEKTLPEISKAIVTPPTNNGWLDHESPYAKPEENQGTPPIIHFDKALVKENPYVHRAGVWIRGLLNKEHPRWRNIWNELKSGTYNAFSMEFMPVHEAKEWVGKELTNVVDQLKYLSTSLVRAPANQGAVITRVYAKSFAGVGYSRSLSATAEVNKNKKGEKKMSEKDLGRETGTTAPERSNTAIGEWGDPTLEKGQAQLQNSSERMAALNKLKPTDTPFAPRQRRAAGAQGKAVPAHDPSQVDPMADEKHKVLPRPARSTQRPEDYKAVRREEEEEEAGFSYEPSEDAPQTSTEATRFEEEEEEEESEEAEMEEAYMKYLKRTTPDRTKARDKALNWLTKKFPTMPIAQALKAAGEMTEILGEVNAPQKIEKEQKPPEVDYGKYGSPDVVPPLATFNARVNDIVKKAVAEKTEEILESVEQTVKRYGPHEVKRKGYGPENTVRSVEAEQESSDDIESQLAVTMGRMGL